MPPATTCVEDKPLGPKYDYTAHGEPILPPGRLNIQILMGGFGAHNVTNGEAQRGFPNGDRESNAEFGAGRSDSASQ